MTLIAKCVAFDNSLQLSSKEVLSNLSIDVSLIERPLWLSTGEPPEKGIGVFDYIKAFRTYPSGITCHLGIEPERYKEIWAQVRSGAFSQCTAHLDVAPLDRSGAHPLWDVRGNYSPHMTRTAHAPAGPAAGVARASRMAVRALRPLRRPVSTMEQRAA